VLVLCGPFSTVLLTGTRGDPGTAATINERHPPARRAGRRAKPSPRTAAVGAVAVMIGRREARVKVNINTTSTNARAASVDIQNWTNNDSVMSAWRLKRGARIIA
jgi:hypothetical protein